MIDLNKKYSVYELFHRGVVSATVINHAQISKTFSNEVKICSSKKEALLNTAEQHKCSKSTVEKVIYQNGT